METKPFNMQSPEQIAKDYGGNKQKIAEAMQMGILDPTAGTLAGMFIDRMRSAAQQEAAPQQTVAQQTFAPPAPPAPPAGLGATPQAAAMPPMAPPPMGPPPEMAPPPPPQEMPAPQGEMPMMAEGGMVPPYASGGGLSDVPIPDGMFDEPSNGGFGDGYAGGGMVAFAAGGRTGYEDFRKAIIAQESGGRYGIANAEGSGAMGIGQIMPGTARAIAKRIGLPYRPELLAGTDEASREYQDTLTAEATKEAFDYGKGDPQLAAQYYFAGPDKKGWGPKTQKYGSDVMRRLGREGTPMPREADTTTTAGRAMSLEDQLAFGKSMFEGLPREAMDRAKAATLEELDPAYVKKQEKLNEAEALTTFGLELMAPENYQGENILGSIAKATKTALGAYGAGKKEQKAAKNAAVRELMAYEELDRKTAIAGIELGVDAFKLGLTVEQQERALAFQEKQLATTVSENALDREVQMAAAMYRAQNPSDFDTKFAMYQKSYPGVSEVAILKQMKTDGLLGSNQAGMAGLVGVDGEMGSAGDANSGMSIVGSRPVQ